MEAIDRIYTRLPFYGVPKMWDALKRQGIVIGRDRTRRLMRLMGLEAIYPKKKFSTSTPDKQHVVYPYLLRAVPITRMNHVWGADITYVRLEQGWCYLYAVMDWYSRFIIGWEVSETLSSEFCVNALKRAIARWGAPEISNTDQGSQFTGADYVGILKAHKIRISMDGRGRCMDNIFTERLWRNVKYEEVYLKSYADIRDARRNLAAYIHFYNHERAHQSLNYKTPAEIYLNKQTGIPSIITPLAV